MHYWALVERSEVSLEVMLYNPTVYDHKRTVNSIIRLEEKIPDFICEKELRSMVLGYSYSPNMFLGKCLLKILKQKNVDNSVEEPG